MGRTAAGSASSNSGGGDASPVDGIKKRKREGEGGSDDVNNAKQRRGKFVEGEVVYAYHGSMLYEAKVMEVGSKTGKRAKMFKLHYKGWGKAKYDEWVAEADVLQKTESNTLLFEQLEKEAKEFSKQPNITTSQSNRKPALEKKAMAAAAAAASAGGAAPGKPTAAVVAVEHVDTVMETVQSNEVEPKIVIPLPLKKQLVDDWERITQKHLLVQVPRDPSVSSFLQEFVEAKSKKGDRDAALHQMAHSLQTLFDLALPKILLYRFERLQFEETIEREPTKKLSDIYGVEHLLRMFVKLPPLLSQIGASEEELRGLRGKLQDMLKFLQRKKDRFLSSTAYVKASLPYVQAFERNLGGAASATSASASASAPASASLSASVLESAASTSSSAPEQPSGGVGVSLTEAVAPSAGQVVSEGVKQES